MDVFVNERFLSYSLSSLSIWSWILPAILGAYYIKSLPTELRWLLYLCIFSIVFEYFSATPFALNQFETPTNYPYYHLAVPVIFGFHLKIFQPVLSRVISGRIIPILLVFFALFCCWNAIWGDGLMHFNGNSLALLSSSCILIGIAFFIYLLRSLSTERPERSSLFWLSVGTVVYYSGSFLLWLAVEYINFSQAEFDSFYSIHSVLGILLRITYCAAIWTAVTYKDQDLLTTPS